MRKRGLKLIAGVLTMSLLLSACAKKRMEAPELLEPVAANESCRTVYYGDIGAVDIGYGTIVPTEHCHFWTTKVNISEIKVDIGDYVNAGDVIAVADIDAANDRIAEIEAELAVLQSVGTQEASKYELKKQELGYKMQGREALGDTVGIAAVNTELAVLEENYRYETLLRQHNIDDMNERISEQRSIAEDGTLRARESGYVTYVKDISSNSEVGNTENVVVLADYDSCYVEMQDTTVEKNVLTNYSYIYTYADGKKYELEEYVYQPAEMIVAQSRSKYPPVRLKYKDTAAMPEVGSKIPIMLYSTLYEDVLVVGKDSLYQDDEGDFVYVKSGTEKEKRYVELGGQDDSNAEVISGLSEGEQVYYVSESVMPEQYEEYTVENGDLISYGYTTAFSIEDKRKLRFFSEYEGNVLEMMFKEGDTVNQGELICTIQTNEGSARLTEMSNAINNFKDEQVAAEKEMENQIAALEDARTAALTQPVPEETATATDATPTDSDVNGTDFGDAGQQTDPYLYEQLTCRIEILKAEREIQRINYNYQIQLMEEEYEKAGRGNNGNGIVSIYADYSGTITHINVQKGKNIKAGDKMFNIEVTAGKKILMRTDEEMAMAQEVLFSAKSEDKVYTGKVSGITGDSTNVCKAYLTTIDDQVFLTESRSDTGTKRFYVTMDDEKFYDTDAEGSAKYVQYFIKDGIAIPAGMVYTEESLISESDNKKFVWKIVNGQMEKQYVNAVAVSLDGEGMSWIISGLSPGDVLAQEKTGTEKED